MTEKVDQLDITGVDTINDAITVHNVQDSPLLRLPAELRLKIYGYVLGGQIVMPKGPSSHMRISCGCHEVFSKYESPISIMLSCRQIHSEAALLPFQLNDFELSSFESFGLFLDRLSGEQRNAISHVQLNSFSEHLWHLWVILTKFRDCSTFPDKYLLPFAVLGGLKCIIWVYADHTKGRSVFRGSPEKCSGMVYEECDDRVSAEHIIDWVGEMGGNESVKVVFKPLYVGI